MVGLMELHKFRENTAEGNVSLYAETKKRVMRYRIAFLIIGLFFLFLSWIIWIKSSLWITIHIKPFVDLIAFLLGIASLTICAVLRYETEAVRALYHHTVHHLQHVYHIRQSKTFKDHRMPLMQILRKKMALRAHFNQTKGKLRKLELETFDLMKRITHSTTLTLKEKELLYNQALTELQERFQPVIKAYEDA